jgi:hypothetical protein
MVYGEMGDASKTPERLQPFPLDVGVLWLRALNLSY